MSIAMYLRRRSSCPNVQRRGGAEVGAAVARPAVRHVERPAAQRVSRPAARRVARPEVRLVARPVYHRRSPAAPDPWYVPAGPSMVLAEAVSRHGSTHHTTTLQSRVPFRLGIWHWSLRPDSEGGYWATSTSTQTHPHHYNTQPDRTAHRLSTSLLQPLFRHHAVHDRDADTVVIRRIRSGGVGANARTRLSPPQTTTLPSGWPPRWASRPTRGTVRPSLATSRRSESQSG